MPEVERSIDKHRREDMYTERSHSQHTTHREPQVQVRCANCDIDILWPPTVVQGKTYCCIGCAAGGPCTCDYSQYRSVNVSGVIRYIPEQE